MSRYGDHFTESADYKRERTRLAKALRERPDWRDVDQYARLRASERVIRVLNALRAEMAEPDAILGLSTADQVREDYRDRVIDLLRLQEAEAHERGKRKETPA